VASAEIVEVALNAHDPIWIGMELQEIVYF
jgi:hypothetical protein